MIIKQTKNMSYSRSVKIEYRLSERTHSHQSIKLLQCVVSNHVLKSSTTYEMKESRPIHLSTVLIFDTFSNGMFDISLHDIF